MTMTHTRPKQVERVLDYMDEFGSITQFEAIRDLGVMRLASRISELRKMGFTIDDAMIPVKNRYGETCHIKQYKLGKEN